MKVLVIGKGGREHALCWKLKQSPRVTAVFCAPGNAGTALDAQNVAIEPGDIRGLIQFAKREGIGLTVVGPEEPLTNGIVDAFQREGLRIFGPRRDAAELEGSKVFAKELMRQAGIPTADYRIFRSAPDAEHYVLSREVSLVVRSQGPLDAPPHPPLPDRRRDARGDRPDHGPARDARARASRSRSRSGASAGSSAPPPRPATTSSAARSGMVLKADGLAAGKGVYVCDNLRQALEAIDQIMVRRIYGKAGDRLILEERLDGQETSILALTDGRTIVPLESSQDHKRAFDHDEGPNTGGMGAYSPAPIVTPELMEQVEREILVPVVHALKRARRPFRGVLYAGLMLTNQGPKVLEFNVRFGDPECQAVLMRLKSDLFEALDAVVDERLDTVDAGVGPAAGGDRGHGLRGLPRPLRARPGDQQPRGGRADGRRQGLPRRDRPADRPGHSAATAGSSPTAAGSSTSPPWATPWPRPRPAPTRPPAPSGSPAPGIAATSPTGHPRPALTPSAGHGPAVAPSARPGRPRDPASASGALACRHSG